jgi:hypothetical protein
VILCEATETNTTKLVENFAEICQSIEAYDYEKVYFDGLNQWWCSKESKTEFIQHFILPPCIFDSLLISPYSGTLARKQMHEISQELSSVTQELSSVTQKLSSTTQKLSRILNSKTWKFMRLLGFFKWVTDKV